MEGKSRVTVHLNADGGLAGVDIEGDIDKTNLVEERRPISTPPVIDNPTGGVNGQIPGLG